jgi:hypothetical protein
MNVKYCLTINPACFSLWGGFNILSMAVEIG